MPAPKLDPEAPLNLGVSLSADLVDWIDDYARRNTNGNFSEAICQILRAYRDQVERAAKR